MRTLTALSIAIAMLASCRDELGKLDCSSIPSSYNTNIKPIISSSCTASGCHDSGSPQGDFTTYDGLKEAAANGKLEEQVIQEKKMPPSGPLPLDDRKKIKCWLNSGAPNN